MHSSRLAIPVGKVAAEPGRIKAKAKRGNI